MGQAYRLFKWCRNLCPGHCLAGMQAVYALIEPIARELLGMGAGYLSGV